MQCHYMVFCNATLYKHTICWTITEVVHHVVPVGLAAEYIAICTYICLWWLVQEGKSFAEEDKTEQPKKTKAGGPRSLSAEQVAKQAASKKAAQAARALLTAAQSVGSLFGTATTAAMTIIAMAESNDEWSWANSDKLLMPIKAAVASINEIVRHDQFISAFLASHDCNSTKKHYAEQAWEDGLKRMSLSLRPKLDQLLALTSEISRMHTARWR